MIILLADHNADGHLRRLCYIWYNPEWLEIWNSLEVRIVAFSDLGLEKNSPDDEVWFACQRHQAILVTNNRNDDGPNSLEATIRTHNHLDALPVITLGDEHRLVSDAEYAWLAAVKIL